MAKHPIETVTILKQLGGLHQATIGICIALVAAGAIGRAELLRELEAFRAQIPAGYSDDGVRALIESLR